MFCTHCGAQNADNSKFCTSCGQSIASTQPPPLPEQQAPNPPQQQQSYQPQQQYRTPLPANQEKMEVWLWIVCILFPIVALILFLVWMNPKPQKGKDALMAGGIGFLLSLMMLGAC